MLQSRPLQFHKLILMSKYKDGEEHREDVEENKLQQESLTQIMIWIMKFPIGQKLKPEFQISNLIHSLVQQSKQQTITLHFFNFGLTKLWIALQSQPIHICYAFTKSSDLSKKILEYTHTTRLIRKKCSQVIRSVVAKQSEQEAYNKRPLFAIAKKNDSMVQESSLSFP